MIIKHNNREAEIEYEGESHDEVFVTGGTWVDTGADLTDDECHEIENDCNGEISQAWLERQIDRAEAFFGGDR